MTYMMKKHTTTFQFRPDGIKSLLLMLLLMMTVGATGAWGETDYSGTYFIANGNGYSSTNAANNFYLVPATNANYATDQPHLTTTKSGQVLNCCWQIVKNGDYYRIIHVADGKYLTANPAMAGTSGNDVGRLRVHLQEFADIAADTDGNTLFNIVLNSKGGYNIRHKDMTDKINNNTTTYLDPAGGNVDGTNLTSLRTASTSNGKVNVGGGIGYWTDEAAARWQFEAVPQNNTYTYNIVDRQGNIAIKYTTGVDQRAAKALSSYTDIPEAIRSPYLNGETVKFYTFSGAFNADNLTDENKITATPVTDGANIYVTYTTDYLSEKFLQLRGARAFNIDDDGCIFDNGGSLGTGGGTPTVTTTTHLWYISGNDPYAVQIKNLSTGNYLVSSALPTLSLAASATNNFILMEESAAANADHESMSLMVATGTGTPSYTTKDVRAYPVNSNVTYHLIDKAGKLIVSVPSTSSELALPGEWVSPLVSEYQYYKDATLSGTAVGSSCDFTGATTVTSPFEVGSGGNIYVKYDVSNAIDITGGKSYLLKFSDGVSFNQENGSDGINTTLTKAVYPYNNGDFNLYVYGQEEWVKQLANGASTRTRWLWKIVSSHNGMLLTGSDIDPYHVVIKSHQNQSLNSGTYAGSTYLRTYKPNNEVGVITGVTYENLTYPDSKPDLTILSPTEYMILGTSMLNMKLTTYNEVEGTRQTVTNFEQYWKNNPTARDILNAADKSVGAQPVTYELPSDQKALLTAKGWHTYECWANAAPWSNTSTGGKTLANGNHWFQTISMGTGLFTVEEVSLAPQVILLDQHGWEVMRVPLTDVATLRKYDSPMVDTYYWYPTALKTTGYHKYHDLDPNIKIYKQNDTKWEWKDEEGYETYTFTSSTLAANPYVDHSEQPASVKTDFYVTYTVKSQYANAYHGAATEDAVTATPYLLKQGGNYATYGGSGTTIGTVATKPSRENLTNNIEWYLKPNFNIDREMGYKYAGETGAQDDAMSKDATEAAYMTNGQNGFDPYNVQIQNRAYPLRYFTANTTGSALSAGLWTGTSGTVALQNMSTKQTAAGYDQTTLNITNATFMVVDDGNGNMRLMPRFDHGMVMQSFGTLAAQAAAASPDDEGTGSQTLFLESVAEAKEIHSSDEMTDPNGYYLLAEDFTFASGFESISNFTGVIDGQLHTISGTLTKPLVNTADGAIIRNVILDNVTISSGDSDGNTGAIACVATGATRIYNCGILSGTVSGSGYTGGLVGWLKETTTDGARVINCYSYADIKGGTDKGGIVGYNNYATNKNDLRTMVMNCMFYGDISGGNKVSPIYGGNQIDNLQDKSGLNTFNYYAYDKLKSKTIDLVYNCAQAVEERFLTRFEIYRQMLNSNKKLAAWYATGSVDNANQMAKWVLETADRTITDPKPYPILKAQGYYPSIINPDFENAPDSATVGRNHGGKLGSKTLSVTITGVGDNAPTGASVNTTPFTLVRTDMDADRFNYNYDKVQLPYYNDYGDKNYTGGKVVTGWKITGFTGGTAGTYTAADQWNGYNFADRKCTNKDLYSVSKRVFSQGAYFDVPYGVTGITIEPYWGNAAFVADERYDYVFTNGYGSKTGIDVMGKQVESSTIFNGVSVKNNIKDALATISSPGSTVYDNAIVLVGNFHQSVINNVEPFKNSNTPFTIMSVDEDNDHEPDYSLIFHDNNRSRVNPIRFDFLNIPGTAQVQKPNSADKILNASVFNASSWFEITNTTLIFFSQFEYENSNKTAPAPIILHGGVYDQFTSTKTNEVKNTTYLHVGGNAWFKEFSNGTHSDGSSKTKHIPISVSGGDYDGFYLTGTYNSNAAVMQDDAECYISSGHFQELAGAGQEQINGNVRWQIYNADIDNFFGGGINDVKPILGNITTDIYNSHVGLFCGGPEFGNMATGKSVTTTAIGCTFDKYFGAGYGGNSINRKKYFDYTSYTWSKLEGYYTNDRGKYYDGNTTAANQIPGSTSNANYGKKGPGVATDFDYEFFVWTNGTPGVRLFVKFANFSLAQCNDVNSTLTGCTINENFYGGGSLGKVTGTVTSVLEDCTVKGNVFGAGFSAQLPTIQVREAGFVTDGNPNYNKKSGMFEPGVYSGTTEFKWKNVSSYPSNGSDSFDGTQVITTQNIEKSNLGSVAGNVTLTIKGNSVIGTAGDTTGEKGNVFGGGESSYVTTNPNITNQKVTVNLEGEAEVLGNVFGGGDKGEVQCSTEVNIRQTAPTTTDPEP